MTKKYYFLFIFLLPAALPVIAQKKLTIVYKSSIQIDKGDLKTVFDNALKERQADETITDSVKNIRKQIAESALNSLDSVVNKNDTYTTIKHVWREKEEVITKEMSGLAKGKKLSKYNTRTLLLTHIDSFTYRKIDSINITKTKLNNPVTYLNTVTYNVEFLNDRKRIQGYNCQKIAVTATVTTDNQLREITRYEIWATKDIKPSIAVNAILFFRKPILTEYTALEIKEISPEAENSYQITTAMSIFEK
jgi:hypothetical protein